MAKCEDRYNKAKAVHSVLRHVADLRGLVLEDLSTKVSWPLYKKYGHAFDAFKLTLQDEEDVFVGLDIDEETKQAMITHIKRRLAPQPSKVCRSPLVSNVSCYVLVFFFPLFSVLVMVGLGGCVICHECGHIGVVLTLRWRAREARATFIPYSRCSPPVRRFATWYWACCKAATGS